MHPLPHQANYNSHTQEYTHRGTHLLNIMLVRNGEDFGKKGKLETTELADG